MTDPFTSIIGESKAIRRICRTIGKFAKSDYTFLIQGDTGVGKERIAEAIHAHSLRPDGPFVKVNCAALPDGLIESELFGHIRGAFTGAHSSRMGLFAKGQNGTILLDEIGAMSPSGQAKLLRVLQEKEFQPVGSSSAVRTNARIIASSNTLLERAAADGSFRPDLYHRLNIVPIHIPPLRERREDIPLLIHHFLKEYCAELDLDIYGFNRQVFENMMNFDWPGNVRQLENFVAYCVVKEDTRIVQAESCPYVIDKTTEADTLHKELSLFDNISLKSSLVLIEGRIIQDVLLQVKGKKSEAARILKIDKKNLAYFLKKHNLGGRECASPLSRIPFTEKRRVGRLDFSVPVSFHFPEENNRLTSHHESIVFTEDISSRGLRFSIPFSPPHHEVHLALNGSARLEEIEGRVCWSSQRGAQYVVGTEVLKGFDLTRLLA
jgi:transcriptional regulator with GAF, ATPase, and Fis domain